MLSIVVLTLASLSVSNALIIPRSLPHRNIKRDSIPATYAQGYLEPYDVYHTRYLALDCEAQHGTPFFDACCHPMLATENLQDNRAPECNPNSATSSSAQPAATQAPQAPQNVAPQPGTPAPSPSTVQPPPPPPPSPSPSPAPAPSPPASGSGGGGLGGALGNLITGGIATFFFQNGVAGACGTVHQDGDFVVALPTEAYANGANCGRKIEIIDPATGVTQTATVADECPTCNNNSCLDLSRGLFSAFADFNLGQFNVQYRYIS